MGFVWVYFFNFFFFWGGGGIVGVFGVWELSFWGYFGIFFGGGLLSFGCCIFLSFLFSFFFFFSSLWEQYSLGVKYTFGAFLKIHLGYSL